MIALLKAVFWMMLAAAPLVAAAQPAKFPERPIRLIIPFAAVGAPTSLRESWWGV